jgi:hypothetical protein
MPAQGRSGPRRRQAGPPWRSSSASQGAAAGAERSKGRALLAPINRAAGWARPEGLRLCSSAGGQRVDRAVKPRVLAAIVSASVVICRQPPARAHGGGHPRQERHASSWGQGGLPPRARLCGRRFVAVFRKSGARRLPPPPGGAGPAARSSFRLSLLFVSGSFCRRRLCALAPDGLPLTPACPPSLKTRVRLWPRGRRCLSLAPGQPTPFPRRLHPPAGKPAQRRLRAPSSTSRCGPSGAPARLRRGVLAAV